MVITTSNLLNCGRCYQLELKQHSKAEVKIFTRKFFKKISWVNKLISMLVEQKFFTESDNKTTLINSYRTKNYNGIVKTI